MKNQLICLLSIVTVLFVFGCKKDSKITDIINPGASMKCKVNGTSWSAVSRVTTLQSNKFIVNGTGSLGSDVLNVTFFGATTGTYNLNTTQGQVQFSATYTNDTGNTDSLYTAYEGTATLTKVDTTNKKVSGTFTFKAKNMQMNNKNITEGTFTDLVYQ